MKAIYLLIIGISLMAGNVLADKYSGSDLTPEDRDAARKLDRMIDDARAKRDKADEEYKKQHELHTPSDGPPSGDVWRAELVFFLVVLPLVLIIWLCFLNLKNRLFLSLASRREREKLSFGLKKLSGGKAEPTITLPTLPTHYKITEPRKKRITNPFPAKRIIPKFLKIENGSIHFECGLCSQPIEIDEAGRGMEIECPDCGKKQKVPTGKRRRLSPDS